MDVVLTPLIWLLTLAGKLIWWALGTIFWIVVWLVLPLGVVAFIGLRVAEAMFGREAVRAWVKARALTFGAGTWHFARRAMFALGALPFRVLFYFVVYAVWHAVISLFVRPKWRPWPRAWAKRWREPPKVKGGDAARQHATVPSRR